MRKRRVYQLFRRKENVEHTESRNMCRLYFETIYINNTLCHFVETTNTRTVSMKTKEDTVENKPTASIQHSDISPLPQPIPSSTDPFQEYTNDGHVATGALEDLGDSSERTAEFLPSLPADGVVIADTEVKDSQGHSEHFHSIAEVEPASGNSIEVVSTFPLRVSSVLLNDCC
jgi:hypothetical protein